MLGPLALPFGRVLGGLVPQLQDGGRARLHEELQVLQAPPERGLPRVRRLVGRRQLLLEREHLVPHLERARLARRARRGGLLGLGALLRELLARVLAVDERGALAVLRVPPLARLDLSRGRFAEQPSG